ncbi:chemotaxis protein CheW [Stakelama sp. CBK3Z-3]|uniref:Chemotaxis protein CheW n=1 Tax=Stakelama flava TaxID=2860338 RepID=A0ABS6XHG4_9SPHN|nr:chemotaxis protein CheW [Stakelama flava]MBW4329649.1 chemotaxis protein CheW [Stakelama flava]
MTCASPPAAVGVGQQQPNPAVQPLDVGLMRLCGRDLAVPAENIREVVPMPDRLHHDFSGTGACTGTIVIRGRVIPVLDIAAHLGFGPRDDGAGVILILRYERALVGLIMDMVSGLARIPAARIQSLEVAGGGEGRIVTSGFPHGDMLVGLVEPGAVFGLPGVVHARESSADAQAGSLTNRRAVVMVSVAETSMAIEAAIVVATLPGIQLKPGPVRSSKWIGVVHYLNHEIPVIDDIALLGLSGRAAEGTGGAIVILRLDDTRMLGVKIDKVRSILPLGAESVRPLASSLAQRLSLFTGAVVDADGSQSLLLDSDALRKSDELRMLGALRRDRPGGGNEKPAAAGAPSVKGERQPFVIFRAGKRQGAARLATVKQIISYPGNVTGARADGSALRGIATYNGAPLPLFDLADTGEFDDRPDRMVLVVEKEGAFSGLVVQKLETIVRAVGQRRPGPNRRGHFIQASVDGTMKAVNLIDLNEEADRLAAQCAPPGMASAVPRDPSANAAPAQR